MATSLKDNTPLKIILGLVVAALVFVALKAGVPWIQRQMVTSSALEQQALADPAMGPLYATMKEIYPQDFERLIEDMSTRTKAGEPAETIRAQGYARMRAFSLSKVPSITRAPEASLVQLADAQRSVVTALAIQDPSLCAQYGSTGLRPDSKPNAPSMRAVGRAGEALLRAAKAGETSPVARALADDPVRLTAFAERLRTNGMSQEQFAMMASPATLMSAPATTQCDITKKLYDGIAQLPDPEKAWVTAYLMNEAAKAMGPVPGA